MLPNAADIVRARLITAALIRVLALVPAALCIVMIVRAIDFAVLRSAQLQQAYGPGYASAQNYIIFAVYILLYAAFALIPWITAPRLAEAIIRFPTTTRCPACRYQLDSLINTDQCPECGVVLKSEH